MRSVAILFPGQGCLTPDAGPQARARWPELVDRAGELLGADPFDQAQATTASAQPAIFVASLAAWRELDLAPGDVRAMAGHSLGEYTALAAAGALDTDDALRLTILRGEAMARAARRHPDGSMVALLGAEPAQAARLAAQHGVALANDNAPGQLVVSGARPDLRALVASARTEGIKTMELDVAGAFHSPDMRDAVLPLRRALEATPRREPRVPVISGHTARPFADLPGELSRAVVAPVRWREVMQELRAQGAEEFVDVGPGRVLERLVKRNPPSEVARGVAA